MFDPRMQARLTQNLHSAAVGYANATAAAMNAFAQQALHFWQLPATTPAPRRDHLSWFNPHGTNHHWGVQQPQETNPWLAFTPWALRPSATPFQPPVTAPQLMAMTWAFAPFAAWWGTMRGPTFAWPMAYSMMAQGVPDDVAWPTAEANAAVMDAATTMTEQAHQAFATYQSAGGFAMAHILPSPQAVRALSAWVAPMALLPLAIKLPALV
jgi:hypothetical protein